jgi:hypothetical protein
VKHVGRDAKAVFREITVWNVQQALWLLMEGALLEFNAKRQEYQTAEHVLIHAQVVHL